MMRQYELVERVKSYDPNANEDLLNRAYVYSLRAHGSQTRASGDPYFSHPVEVAGILTELKLDCASICTGLLHDTVEDTVSTLDDIQTHFGGEITRLVDGVTKLSRIELQSDRTKQAENFRKLLLAMSEDIRVLFVKLADRLHNMRTLHFISNQDKRQRVARETLDIYAPLAERIGIAHWKDELEDLAFQHLNQEARDSILARLGFLRKDGIDLVERIRAELEDVIKQGGVDSHVLGREKRPYSIWRKMERKNVGFEQLADIVAFRIIVKDLAACYQALGIIHAHYRMVPGRFKDFISTPKSNGYKSLHTTVIGPSGNRIEVQIRTEEMHAIAEYGLAAHWAYKESAKSSELGRTVDGRQYRWLRELLEILEHAAGPEDFLEHTKMEMFADQVFVFTPKGELISLPKGSTAVDFAYAVHSEVGDTCVGAKVNGRMQPLRTPLQNGDQLEVLTSKTSTPNPTWLNFVVTGKARTRIRRFIRQQQHDEFARLGREVLAKAFRQAGVGLREKALAPALKRYNCASTDDLFAAVGQSPNLCREILVLLHPDLASEEAKPKKPGIGRRKRSKKADEPIAITGLIPGMAVHFAGCCHPLPGDRIVGIVTTGKGVTIHTIDCESLQQFVDQPERWLDVAWSRTAEKDRHTGRIDVVVTNEPGSLSSLSTAIAKNGGNISNLKITGRSEDFFEMLVDIQVSDVRHLSNIMAALRADPLVTSVERARS